MHIYWELYRLKFSFVYFYFFMYTFLSVAVKKKNVPCKRIMFKPFPVQSCTWYDTGLQVVVPFLEPMVGPLLVQAVGDVLPLPQR